MFSDPRFAGLTSLIVAVFSAPAGIGRTVLAPGFGFLNHLVFAIYVLLMVTAVFFGGALSGR